MDLLWYNILNDYCNKYLFDLSLRSKFFYITAGSEYLQYNNESTNSGVIDYYTRTSVYINNVNIKCSVVPDLNKSDIVEVTLNKAAFNMAVVIISLLYRVISILSPFLNL